MDLGLLCKAVQRYRQGLRGEAAVLKAAAFGATAYPELESRLRGLSEPFPTIDLDALRRLPAGTFGHAYATFMDANHLTPLSVSRELAAELSERSVLAVRYPIVHDAFHVLLGFDTSLAGELGVWSFVSAQHYGHAYDRAATLGRLFYPLVAPWQWRRLRASDARGQRLAERAVCLIEQAIQRYWQDPLSDVRRRFQLA